MTMGFIGTGVMGSAMLQAALDSGFLKPEEVVICDKNPQTAGRFGVAAAGSVRKAAKACDVLQLGVKPQDMPALLEDIQPVLREGQLVVSIAAGFPLSEITPYTPRHAPNAVRLMPNINATVGQAITAYCASESVPQEQLDFIKGYCGCFGQAIALEEKHFSAFVGLAGSAPAFVYLFIDELARAGVAAGLPKAQALEIASQTVLGSAALVQQSGKHPYELIDNVCSPGGTTIAGINKLRELGFAHAISQAALASYRRDRELQGL